MNSEERLIFISEVSSLMRRYDRVEAGCLYWADTVVNQLAARGISAIIQAGSLMWPRIRPEQDDGVSPTHFSYVWDAHSPLTMSRVRQRLLPEMHVWAAIPMANEIIDLTTKFLPHQCKQIIGYDWPGDLPPDYLWATVAELPAGVIYDPSIEAIAVALLLLGKT